MLYLPPNASIRSNVLGQRTRVGTKANDASGCLDRSREGRWPTSAKRRHLEDHSSNCGRRATHIYHHRNLHRRYYRLLSSTLGRPRLAGATWALHPDENGLIDWDSVQEVLHNAGRRAQAEEGVLLWRRAQRRYAIEQIVPMDSLTTALVQIADLIAGLIAYSHDSFAVYDSWCRYEIDKVQLSLALPDESIAVPAFSLSDRERCQVLQHLDRRSKHRRMG